MTNCVHIAQTQTDHKMVSGHMNSRHTVFEALVELRILLLLVLLKNLEEGFVPLRGAVLHPLPSRPLHLIELRFSKTTKSQRSPTRISPRFLPRFCELLFYLLGLAVGARGARGARTAKGVVGALPGPRR